MSKSLHDDYYKWSTRAVLMSTCSFFTFYPFFHHPSSDTLACFHPIITFHFALWCQGRNRWKAAAFSFGGKQSVHRKCLSVSPIWGLLSHFLSFVLFFSSSGRPEEQMLKHCSHNAADLIRKLRISMSEFPKLWVLCYHKQKYDGLWGVTLTFGTQTLIPEQ